MRDEFDDLLDQVVHVRGRAGDLRHLARQARGIGRGVGGQTALEQLGGGLNGGQRVAQVVRHDAEEAIAVAHRVFRAQARGALARFGLVAGGEVEDEAHPGERLAGEQRAADEDGHAAAVPAEELLLERRGRALRQHLVHGAVVGRVPLRRSHLAPAHAARRQVGAGVADHLEEGVIGVEDPRLAGLEDADDVAVHEALEPSFARAQRLFDAFARGHVLRDDQNVVRCLGRA